MKALLLSAPGRLEYLDVPEPAVGPDDVLVRVRAAGICGSDIHGMDGSTGRRVTPLIMGHEAAGVIEAVGGAVSGWRAGDAVTFDSTIWCGECSFCASGRVNLCDRRRVLGVSPGDYRQDGAFAEYVAVPARILYALPGGLSMTDAALAEPLAVAAHAVSRASMTPTTTAVVIGAGVIGLFVMAVLKASGCERIVAVDLSPARLERARTIGATDVVPAGGDAATAILDLTHGRGADVAFEAVGIDSTVGLAVASVARGGTVVLVGNLAPTVGLALQAAVSRELSLLGSAASSGEYPRALELLASRRIDAGSLISAVAPLSEGADWFDRLRTPGTDLLKVILEP
ncbi:MAG TPA: galactitol-1-phosphate 5-dehydrogenase [Candidatus Limnocylindrales bacterium]